MHHQLLSLTFAAALMGAGSVAAQPAPEAPQEAAAVVAFWREAGPSLWFAKDPSFDERFRTRFLSRHEAAGRGELDHWSATPDGALALVILLDQFPRNAFRGSPRMYATDDLARAVADKALARGFDAALAPDVRVFLYLPFGHSEALSAQQNAVDLCAKLGEPTLSRARHHQAIVARFGRFPHRNAILRRAPTPEEQSYLAAGGYAG